MIANPVFLLHLISCAAMMGVIWIVQLTHYPTFRFVREEEFTRFERFHSQSISVTVIPFMLVELITGLWLLISGVTTGSFLLSLGILLAIWATTFCIQVPLHAELGKEFNPAAIEKLIRSNWLRTIGWTCRTVILGIIALRSARG